MSRILHLLLVDPVHFSVELANSALSYVMTELRRSMHQDPLNDSILLDIHKDIPLDYDRLIDRFASKSPRRMLLTDPMKHPDDECYS